MPPKSDMEGRGLKIETVRELQAVGYFRLNISYSLFERHRLVQYFTLSIFIHLFKRTRYHKDIKQQKAHYSLRKVSPTPLTHTRTTSLRWMAKRHPH